MINIGITGQKGFIGSHLFNTLSLFPKKYNLIEFQKNFFDCKDELDSFVSKCDVIVHLAALNRHKSQSIIYETNIKLVSSLIEALNRTKNKPHIIISSSSQEKNENLYGKSKKIGRLLFTDWAKNNKAIFTGLIIPNVFGPFGKPNYNSVVATFCYQLVNNKKPKIDIDGNLKLIYVSDLINEIINCIEEKTNNSHYVIKHDSEIKVSKLLDLLKKFKTTYVLKGEIPLLNDLFNLKLFNTFRSYINMKTFFPVKLTKHNDDRGSFVEIVRLGLGGQVSFSTTFPGVIRGNHFHTRKIERFAVIKGKALIELRQIGTDQVYRYFLDGNEPAFVDMPIWYTHNIKNIGDDVLYTIFWINEKFNHDDPDTFFVNV